MSLHEFRIAEEIWKKDPPFYSLIMAAMQRSDTVNQAKLRKTWPDIWDESLERYNSPGGMLPSEMEKKS